MKVTTKDTHTEVNAYKTKYMVLSHQEDIGQNTNIKTAHKSSENVLGSTHFETILHIKIIHVILRPGFKYREWCCVSVNLGGKKLHHQQSKILLNSQKEL
jgi:hypothetical protein